MNQTDAIKWVGGGCMFCQRKHDLSNSLMGYWRSVSRNSTAITLEGCREWLQLLSGLYTHFQHSSCSSLICLHQLISHFRDWAKICTNTSTMWKHSSVKTFGQQDKNTVAHLHCILPSPSFLMWNLSTCTGGLYCDITDATSRRLYVSWQQSKPWALAARNTRSWTMHQECTVCKPWQGWPQCVLAHATLRLHHHSAFCFLGAIKWSLYVVLPQRQQPWCADTPRFQIWR